MTPFAHTVTNQPVAPGASLQRSPDQPSAGNVDDKEMSRDDEMSEDSVDRSLTDDERFELLSAYMDGEVSDEERQQVERWLASDAQIQRHYSAQVRLRQAMKSLFDA